MSNKSLIIGLSLILHSVLISAAFSAEYIAAKRCRGCHMEQYESWKKTTMATSYENLKSGVRANEKKKAGLDPDKDYTNDPDCLRCHTTGYGRPGGFISIEKTPDLINVQCESCHGPGADFRVIMSENFKFKLSEVVAAGLLIPDENNNNCLECHGSDSPFTEEVDPKYRFDIKERLKNTHEKFPLKYEH